MKTRFLTLLLALVATSSLAGCSGSATCNCSCGNKADASPSAATPDALPSGSDTSSWTPVGGTEVDPTRATDGKIAVSNGVPYAAFQDSLAGGKLSVMKLSGSKWANVGTAGFTSSSVYEFSIYLDNATPYVAFTTYTSGYSLNVMKFDGTQWVLVGNANFATVSGYSSSATFSFTVSGGVPYIAFSDQNSQLHVQTVTGGVWVDLGGTYVALNGQYQGLTIFNGQPTVVFANSSYVLTLLTFTGTAWVPLATSTLTLDTTYGSQTSLTVSNGTLYVIFYSSTYGDGGTSIGPVVLQLNGGVLVPVGTLGSISNGDYIEYVSGVVYNGVPYVAFDDEAKDGDLHPQAATVKYFDGTSWKLYAGYPDDCDIENTYLAVDPTSGTLYFTYSDCNNVMTVKVH